MSRRRLLAVGVALTVTLPASAAGALPVAAQEPSLPTCPELATDPAWGLVDHPAVVEVSAAEETAFDRSYCRVDITWSTPGLSGPDAGYADGESQSIRMGIALPAREDWTEQLIMTAGGGAQGSVPNVVGGAADTVTAKISIGAIGAGTDSGHVGGTDFGVIQETNTLNTGKITDWIGRSNGTAVSLTKELANTYYGNPVDRTYWQGGSGGGHQGWTQVIQFPEEYDGALIGYPANHWQRFRLADSWDEVVRRKVAQQTDPITAEQFNAANSAAVAACDGDPDQGGGTVADGTLSDPRACTWSATLHICGVPGAPEEPLCLDEIQAEGIDTIWDGPRNSHGTRIWHPYDRGVSLGVSTDTQGSTTQVMQWNRADLTFNGSNLYQDQESIDLAAAAGVDVTDAVTYEEEAVLTSAATAALADASDRDLDAAREQGLKIIVYHGTADAAIHYRNAVDHYRRVATYFGDGQDDFESLQDWYRLYLAPGGPHGGSSVPPDGLTALIDWVENDVAPDELSGQTAVPTLCPFPQQAIYSGSGDTSDQANYTCGGDLDANPVALCQMPRAKFGLESRPALNTDETGISPGECRRLGLL
jgi:hypothetical protein